MNDEFNKHITAFDMYDFERKFSAGGIDDFTWNKIERVKVDILTNTIIPDMTSKIKKYYPHNFFSTYDTDTSNIEENILIDFLSVDILKPKSIEHFIQNYGYLYVSIDTSFFDYLTDIDGNPINYTNVPYFAKKLSLSAFEDEHTKLKFLFDCYQKIKSPNLDISKLVNECKKHLKYFDNTFLKDLSMYEKNSIDSLLSVEKLNINGLEIPMSNEEKERKRISLYVLHFIREEINKKISTDVHITPRVDSSKEIIKESWYFKDLTASLYYQFYMSIRDKKNIKKCAKPTCPNYFFVTNSKRIFCCNKCAKNYHSTLSKQRAKNKLQNNEI